MVSPGTRILARAEKPCTASVAPLGGDFQVKVDRILCSVIVSRLFGGCAMANTKLNSHIASVQDRDTATHAIERDARAVRARRAALIFAS